MVHASILAKNEEDLRKKIMKYEKLKDGDIMKEKCETKAYIKTLSVSDARHIFTKKHA